MRIKMGNAWKQGWHSWTQYGWIFQCINSTLPTNSCTTDQILCSSKARITMHKPELSALMFCLTTALTVSDNTLNSPLRGNCSESTDNETKHPQPSITAAKLSLAVRSIARNLSTISAGCSQSPRNVKVSQVSALDINCFNSEKHMFESEWEEVAISKSLSLGMVTRHRNWKNSP